MSDAWCGVAYKDLVGKEDNSWWESFGAAGAAMWVQFWLMAVFGSMCLALLIGPIQIILDPKEAWLPCSFGMLLATIQVWTLWEPTFYVVKSKKLKMSLRCD